jgi:TetR/AcrR family transcriptional regulator, lmrAB and yxaGH operons repressor
MAQQTNENTALIQALFDIFRNHGYEGTTISLLSEVTGLQKSSLYHHFPKGKEDMLKAVVEFVSAQIQQHIIAPLLDTQVKPEKRFSNMIATIKAFYSDGRKNCLLNVLNLGDVKTEINKLQNNDYEAWQNALVELGKEVGLSQQEAKNWAERFIIIIEGALVIQRLTGDKQTFEKHMEYEQKQFREFLNKGEKS